MPDLNVALRIRADLQNAVRQVDRLEKELRQTGRAGRQAAQGTRQAAASIERAGRAADRSSRGFSRLQGAVAGISFVLLAREAVQLVGSITRTGLAFERLEQRFTFAAGSIRQGAEEFRFVREESERLGLAFQPAAQGLSQLQGAVRGTGISLAQTREIFLGVAEAATVLRLSQDQVAGAFRAIEQIASKGTLQAEEIRGQLGERLPGAFQIAARAMGVTTAELNKMLEQGEVLSDDFLPRFGAQLRREFGDAAEEASDSAQASFNRLGNSIERLAESIAKSGLLEFLADAADRIAALTDAIGTLDERLDQLEAAGGDRSVPGGGLSRDQAAALREEGLPTSPTDFLRLARRRREAIARQIAEREAEGPTIDIGSLIPIIGTPDLEDLRADFAKVDEEVRRLENSIADARERAARERARAGPTREAAPEPDREAIEEFLEETDEANFRSLQAFRRHTKDLESAAEARYKQQLRDSREAAREAIEAARGNAEEETRILAAQKRRERLLENEFNAEIRKIRDDEVERRRRLAEKAARNEERLAKERERLSKRQRDAVRGVEEAIADAELDLSGATDTERAIAEITRWRDTHLRALEEVGLANSIFAQRVRESAARQIEATREQATVLGSLRAAMRDYAREAGDAADEAAGAFNSAVRGMEDALVSFVQTGKLSFSDLANSIIADIARIVVRQQILGPLVGALGGGGGLFGGLFHAGGVVGHGTRSRSVDPRAFAFAPRYHDGGVAGLRPDEVPAILQRGETVLPRGAGLPMPVPVHVTVESTGTPQRAQGATARLDPEGFVIRIMVDDAESGGPHSQALRRFISGGSL